MSDYISNCPNCGAPLRGYGRCEYCGTTISQPLQILAVRPGMRKLVCQTEIPAWLGEKDAAAAAKYAKRGMCEKMADALMDSIKFITKRDFDYRGFDEIIAIRGELWVGEPGASY